MNPLIRFDHALFGLLNNDWHNAWFDTWMPFMRNPQFWAPLYFFLIVFSLFNFGKQKWWWILFAALTAIITNYVSSDLVKEHIIRLRPCNNPQMSDTVRFLLNYRPQSSSFTSSHAANHFGLATFLYFTLKNRYGKWPLLFFAWAFIIGYAQIYVGVHFPLDIVGGTLIGLVFGYLSASIFNKYYGLS